MTQYSEIPEEKRGEIGNQVVLDAYDIVGELAIGDETDYEQAYKKLAVIARYEKEQLEKDRVHLVEYKRMQEELATANKQLDQYREAVEYALGCIDGTIRDYNDELPKKLRVCLSGEEGKQ